MKRLILSFAFICIALLSQAQTNPLFKLNNHGVCLDAYTNKDYTVIELEGTKSELYNKLLKRIHELMIDPKEVLSTLENEMISWNCQVEKPIKFAGLTRTLRVLLSTKIEFKENKIKVSMSWVDTWYGDRHIDVYTLLSVGGLKCFDKKGEISSEKRYEIYQTYANELLQSLLKLDNKQEDW